LELASQVAQLQTTKCMHKHLYSAETPPEFFFTPRMAQKVMATSKNKQKLLLKKIPFLFLCFNIQIYISNPLLPLGGDGEHAEIHYKKGFHLDQTNPN
jgi:hypothetical protein